MVLIREKETTKNEDDLFIILDEKILSNSSKIFELVPGSSIIFADAKTTLDLFTYVVTIVA